MNRYAKRQEFKISLPATSANIGPAFDAAALALDLWLHVRAVRAKQYSVAATGLDTDICGEVENHLILRTYEEVLRAEGKNAVPLALRIHNEFPIGKGLGSSAAARLTGVALAVHFGALRWSSSRMVGEASRREHHSDNAAACWVGGVAVSRMSGDGEAKIAHFIPKGKWPLLLAISNQILPTEKARAALPKQYSREDTVSNIQNSLLLLSALVRGDRELLGLALDDRIHQPYRAPLCPLLPALKDLPGQDGVLGSVLSGAGPSVLMFLDGRKNLEKTRAKVAKHLTERGMSAQLLLTSIVKRGGEASFRRNQK